MSTVSRKYWFIDSESNIYYINSDYTSNCPDKIRIDESDGYVYVLDSDDFVTDQCVLHHYLTNPMVKYTY